MSYQIEYADAAIEHLKFLTTRQQRTVLDTVDEQLKYEPLVETRNRKPMEPNSLATWEPKTPVEQASCLPLKAFLGDV